MFKKGNEPQIDIFNCLSNNLSSRKSKILEDSRGWHNVFYRDLYCRINESIFSVLYKEGGRPNASIRTLLSMIILKEGNGWSDEQLFDNCRFNLRCMAALGQVNMDEDIPTESTYYDFRSKLSSHQEKTSDDLVLRCFGEITNEQIKSYNVKGEKIRLDSKLLQSNIRKCSRLELVLGCVSNALSKKIQVVLIKKISKEDYDFIKELVNKKPSSITYKLNKSEASALLIKMGRIIELMLPHISPKDPLHLLYKEQYTQDRSNPEDQNSIRVSPKPPKEISSNSLQSPHDTQASYRSKGHGASKQTVTGYHANITETCSGNQLELIIEVALETACVSEDKFLLPAIENSKKILEKPEIYQVSCDGGYDSISNRTQMFKKGMPQWNISKHKGSKQRFKMWYNKQGNLNAYCIKTKAMCQVKLNDKKTVFSIRPIEGPNRYYTQDKITAYIQAQHMDRKKDKPDQNIRANVEATIHQVFHRLDGNKTKYRGMFKNKLYIVARCYWTNYRRILSMMEKQGKTNLKLLFIDVFRHVKTLRQYTYRHIKISLNPYNTNNKNYYLAEL